MMGEVELATAVQAARNALQALLTADEWKTRRTSGSDYPETFEDAAREIAQYDFDDRAAAVGEALAAYQAALNALWQHAVIGKIHERLAAAWYKKRAPLLDQMCTTYNDALSEAMWLLRIAAAKYQPGEVRLIVYAYKWVIRGLDTWWDKQRVPVELPEKVAREGFYVRRSHPATFPDSGWNEENHMLTVIDCADELERIAQELNIPMEDLLI